MPQTQRYRSPLGQALGFEPFGLYAPRDFGSRRIPVNVIRGEGTVTLQYDLPGVHVEDIELEFERGALKLEASRTIQQTRGDETVRYAHVATLGDRYSNEVQASLHDGVLTVTVSELEQARPQRISISTTVDDVESKQDEISS